MENYCPTLFIDEDTNRDKNEHNRKEKILSEIAKLQEKSSERDIQDIEKPVHQKCQSRDNVNWLGHMFTSRIVQYKNKKKCQSRNFLFTFWI